MELNADHIFCMRHLHTNFRISFKEKDFKDALYAAVKASTGSDFKNKIKALSELDQKVIDWLLRQDTSL